jgi:hypothetical protein
MENMLSGTRLFGISDMLKILNDIVSNYPKFGSLVVNFASDTNATSFVQFMIAELIPYPVPNSNDLSKQLSKTNTVKPEKSIIAANLLKNIACLHQDYNALMSVDSNSTKFILNTLVKHITLHSNTLFQLSSYNELCKQHQLVNSNWNPSDKMNDKLIKKHETKILREIFQIKSNLEVLCDLVKTPNDKFCRFAARILADSEVIDKVCSVLESKFDLI